VLTLLLSIPLTATAQQNKPQENVCKEDATCGIIATFKPPIGDALLVPNEVTVDVPLVLHATKVIVQSYPLGTGVADIPSEGLAAMNTSRKSVSTHGSAAKLTNVPNNQVSKSMSSVKALSTTR
jgi:hypothetical protein